MKIVVFKGEDWVINSFSMHFINTFQERMKPFISTMMLGIM